MCESESAVKVASVKAVIDCEKRCVKVDAVKVASVKAVIDCEKRCVKVDAVICILQNIKSYYKVNKTI